MSKKEKMNNHVCKNFEKCPIFQKDVLFSERTGETYKRLFCENNRFNSCKRYLVSEIVKKPISEKIMPNSVLSVDELVEKINSGFFD